MNVTLLKQQIATLQAALTTVLASPGPNYSIGGAEGSRTISKADYIKMLIDELKALNDILALVEPTILTTRHILVG